ncbi:putative epoxide hydrolase [Aspergillus fumigatus]
MSAFSKLPSGASIALKPFRVSIPEEELDEFQALLKLSKIAPPTFENSRPSGQYGITSDWLTTLRKQWQKDFDWRACEAKANLFPQFTVDIEDIKLKFAALYSKKPDAVPITLIHGWPGSYTEFLPMLQLFSEEFTPITLPYHLIVPSLPGCAFSWGPPLDRDFTSEDSARILDKLMQALGLVGAILHRVAILVPGCLGSWSLTMLVAKLPIISCSTSISTPLEIPTAIRKKGGVERMNDFLTFGRPYAYEHATRPSTIGHVLSSSPIALLAWCGKNFLDWVNDSLPLDTILEFVSLYWFTKSFPRAIYPYREMLKAPHDADAMHDRLYIQKPLGFSYFPNEIIPAPKAWVSTTGNLVFWRQHDKGGHFAALERPHDLKAALSAFVEQVWPEVASK